MEFSGWAVLVGTPLGPLGQQMVFVAAY